MTRTEFIALLKLAADQSAKSTLVGSMLPEQDERSGQANKTQSQNAGTRDDPPRKRVGGAA